MHLFELFSHYLLIYFTGVNLFNFVSLVGLGMFSGVTDEGANDSSDVGLFLEMGHLNSVSFAF